MVLARLIPPQARSLGEGACSGRAPSEPAQERAIGPIGRVVRDRPDGRDAQVANSGDARLGRVEAAVLHRASGGVLEATAATREGHSGVDAHQRRRQHGHRTVASRARANSAPGSDSCPLSTNLARAAARARSPRPAQATRVGCSSRPPGTTCVSRESGQRSRTASRASRACAPDRLARPAPAPPPPRTRQAAQRRHGRRRPRTRLLPLGRRRGRVAAADSHLLGRAPGRVLPARAIELWAAPTGHARSSTAHAGDASRAMGYPTPASSD